MINFILGIFVGAVGMGTLLFLIMLADDGEEEVNKYSLSGRLRNASDSRGEFYEKVYEAMGYRKND